MPALRLAGKTATPPYGRRGFERQENGARFSSGCEKITVCFHKEGGHIASPLPFGHVDHLGYNKMFDRHLHHFARFLVFRKHVHRFLHREIDDCAVVEAVILYSLAPHETFIPRIFSGVPSRVGTGDEPGIFAR